MTTRTEVASYWYGDLHLDMGEAMCWACRRWDGSGQEGAYEDADWLERCHLVPASLGGSDAPENLVMLCARCHREMPNVLDRTAALSWVRVPAAVLMRSPSPAGL
jgi:hypothetical protein